MSAGQPGGISEPAGGSTGANLHEECDKCLTINGLSLMQAARNIEATIGLPCLATAKGLKAAWRDTQSIIYKLQMYQLAHDNDDHELIAVAVCWSRLCTDVLIRNRVVCSKPFKDGFLTLLRDNRCELCLIAALYLFTILCRHTHERAPFETASFCLRGSTAIFRHLLTSLSVKPQNLLSDLIIETAVAFFSADFSTITARDPTLRGDSQTGVLVAIVELLPAIPAPAIYGLIDLIIDKAHVVEDLESEENRPLLLFLIGVLHSGGAHDKLRVLRVLATCRAAREVDKRTPWSPSRFLRVIREDNFNDAQRAVLCGGGETRARFVRVLTAGADIMRAFAVHRSMFTVAILWWQLVYEEPRCRHFDAACGRRFGYGTRSPRSCGFPFDAWQDTFLHCAAVLRASPFETLQPHMLPLSSCVSPDDVADVLQIQYHLTLNQLAEAESLLASARARNPSEIWFLYAWSELGETNAIAALEALAEGAQPGRVCTPTYPIVDRIVRNCYKWVYWDLARGIDSQDSQVLFLKLRRFLEVFRDKVDMGGIPSDSPDRGWSVVFHAIISILFAVPHMSYNPEMREVRFRVTPAPWN
ncbi:hypothetical protein AURDEDRAFT_162352 [Auricularia subglabra TFB-10046 SS5]|nr:hypothetical protein AURDEDRAFT_162352 [Auricularia subglabra TFB-10046 SS5]